MVKLNDEFKKDTLAYHSLGIHNYILLIHPKNKAEALQILGIF